MVLRLGVVTVSNMIMQSTYCIIECKKSIRILYQKFNFKYFFIVLFFRFLCIQVLQLFFNHFERQK